MCEALTGSVVKTTATKPKKEKAEEVQPATAKETLGLFAVLLLSVAPHLYVICPLCFYTT